MKHHLLKFVVLAALPVCLLSCETVSYYSQAARGQLAIMLAREDMQRLMDRPGLSPALREKFALVMAVREFAEQELALPVADNYSTYVDLEREHLVWNVFAAPEFSTEPVNWCYPVAGCAAYRGYFSEAAARDYARRLERDGFDVYVGGVDAYSTLGWFDDPLPSTVISRPDYRLAGLIFHELAHQAAYLPGDTTFNESFATVVEREGVRRWLQTGGRRQAIAAVEQERRRHRQFIGLVSGYREQFDALYRRELSADRMRQAKAGLRNRLRNDYRALQTGWGGYGGYDAWFSGPLNNAQLGTVTSYNDLTPFFNALLEQAGGDMAVFFAEVNKLVAMDAEERRAVLNNE